MNRHKNILYCRFNNSDWKQIRQREVWRLRVTEKFRYLEAAAAAACRRSAARGFMKEVTAKVQRRRTVDWVSLHVIKRVPETLRGEARTERGSKVQKLLISSPSWVTQGYILDPENPLPSTFYYHEQFVYECVNKIWKMTLSWLQDVQLLHNPDYWKGLFWFASSSYNDH